MTYPTYYSTRSNRHFVLDRAGGRAMWLDGVPVKGMSIRKAGVWFSLSSFTNMMEAAANTGEYPFTGETDVDRSMRERGLESSL